MSVFAPATRVASRKLGPTRGSASPCSSSARAACETSTFAITCGRWLTVASSRSCVSASIAIGRAPDRDDEAMQPFVQEPGGALARRQVPGRALEQVRARVLDTGGLRAGDRVAADEALVGDRLDDPPLRRADVGDDAVVRGSRERALDELGQRADRPAGEADLGALERLLRCPWCRDRSRRARARGRAAPAAAEADDVRVVEPLLGGKPDRASDQPDSEDGDAHARPARRLSARARLGALARRPRAGPARAPSSPTPCSRR